MLAGAGLVEGTDYQTVLLDGFDPLAHYALDGIVGFPGYKSNEPGQLERAGLPFDLFDPTEFDVPGSFGVIFTTRQFADEHPTAVQDFLRATMRGLADAIADPAAADADGDRPRRGQRQPELPVAGGRVVPVGDRRRAARRRDPGGTGMGVPDLDLLQAEVDAYAEVGLFGGEAPDVAPFVDAAPIAGVYDDTGQVIWPG